MIKLPVNIAQSTVSCTIVHKPVKRLVLKVKPTSGLQCICPKGTNNAAVERFIAQQHVWISKQMPLLLMAENYLTERMIRPDQLSFPCMHENWIINYVKAHRSPRIQTTAQMITVYSNGSIEQIRKLLNQWLLARAIGCYQDILDKLSKMSGLHYQKLSVGKAHTRWGSCDQQNHIRLNKLLIFLPTIYVHHVMLHELCHTVHHNHSREFWSLLAINDTNTPKLRKLLRDSQKTYSHIPAFFW